MIDLEISYLSLKVPCYPRFLSAFFIQDILYLLCLQIITKNPAYALSDHLIPFFDISILIEMLFRRTFIAFRTAVADIRRFRESGANIFFIKRQEKEHLTQNHSLRKEHSRQTICAEHQCRKSRRQTLKALPYAPLFSKQMWFFTSSEMVVQFLLKNRPIALKLSSLIKLPLSVLPSSLVSVPKNP